MKKLNVAIVLGAIVAVFGAALVVVYGRHVDNRIADGKQTVDVLVADRSIPQGSSLATVRASTHVAQVPTAYVVAHPLASLDTLTGTSSGSAQPASTATATYVTLGPITSGSQVSSDMFGPEGSTSVLTPATGHVAVAVSTDITPGVANYVTSGAKVDIFVTYTGATSGTGSSTSTVNDVTKMFMSDVRVLSTSYAVKNTSSKNSSGQTVSTPTDQFVAVLDLSPTDAEKVINAQQLGDLYFALNTGAAHTTPTGADPGDVVGSNR